MGCRSKGLSVLERLKPSENPFQTGFIWMKETLDFSFWQRKKLLQSYFDLFSSELPITYST
jgi:hypothetical protein